MLHYSSLSAISMVYNFRIAQITKQPIFEKTFNRNHTIVALLFDQFYKKRNNTTHQNYAGGLGSFIYDCEPYYFRIDAALSNIRQTDNHITTFSGTETDDILFTVGRNFIVNEQALITLSGLFGVPTHKIFRLRHPDFGYSQVGMGIQLDGSYTVDCIGSLLYGARYIYFVPRNALDDCKKKYNFTIGNVGDILLAYKNTWNQHGLELGYTFRSQFGAHIRPNLDDTVEKTNYLRSNFYIVYKYKFLTYNVANRLLFNFSYGFDHNPKTFGNKHIITLWASWNIGF